MIRPTESDIKTENVYNIAAIAAHPPVTGRSAARRVGSPPPSDPAAQLLGVLAIRSTGTGGLLCECRLTWFRGVSMRVSGCAVLRPRIVGIWVRDTPTEAVACAMLAGSAAVVGGAGRGAAVATRRRAMGAPRQPGFLVDHELSLAWSGRFGLA
jgi:hypothetical protein